MMKKNILIAGLFLFYSCRSLPIKFIEAEYSIIDVDFEFKPQDTSVEKKYLYKNSGSKLAQDARYADGFGFWIYKFEFVPNSEGQITFLIDNQYKVSISNDGENYSPFLLSGYKGTDGQNKIERTLEISEYLINSSGTIFLKFEDEVPENGWGARLYSLKIKGTMYEKID